MANRDNKEFLDKLGVQKLWDKINQYFSQIGHRHETSDVNGLDEYMEENAKAIRDTEKVVEELSELPLYPSEEQLGIIYACNGRLYRAKKLQKLVIDFSKFGDSVIAEDIIHEINKNGLNIIMTYYDEDNVETASDLMSYNEFEKYNNGIYFDGDMYFQFEGRNYSEETNYWNQIYIKSAKITVQSPYNEDAGEVWQGCVEYYIDDYGDVHTIDSQWRLDDSFEPQIQTKTFNFGKDEECDLFD